MSRGRREGRCKVKTEEEEECGAREGKNRRQPGTEVSGVFLVDVFLSVLEWVIERDEWSEARPQS